jgi:hypothetical protein
MYRFMGSLLPRQRDGEQMPAHGSYYDIRVARHIEPARGFPRGAGREVLMLKYVLAVLAAWANAASAACADA